MNTVKRLYFVCSDDEMLPPRKMDSYESAMEEADRLAALNPNTVVHIITTEDVRLCKCDYVNNLKIID